MHIVVSGYYGFGNVGDEAILFSIIEQLRMVEPTIKITILSNNPEETKRTYQVNAVNRRKITEISQALRESDGLISGGGSLLQDKTGMLTIPYYTGIIKLAKWLQKPVFIYAQGMGPINGILSKWLVKYTLNNVEQITVRDEASQHLLTKIGVKHASTIVPDPVLGLDSSSYDHQWEPAHKFTQKFITVSVRDWPTNKPFTQKIASTLDQLVQDGYAVVFVPMHGEKDERKSQETAELMTEHSYISPANASLQAKIALIGESNLLIGMRLHSLIFSAINYTPFVAISYDPKIDAFASLCDQPVVGHVEEDNWDSQQLYHQTNHALHNKEFKRMELRKKVRTYQREARNTPELALAAFFGQRQKRPYSNV
ncbi:polysaccharide pyruvyl transferase CsaB [Lentibacillus populi]|uniref:Polysaccharide pyruvyl transferase CsaB n=1 Tax=Lentibacillus populi TaxID=1827502 RepID=A0A9W5X7X3_9BACI|nr:polysaccharide pyruvyl transferase CsaB [Lentibacillus populi]GGB60049.1 polysaccharide pyruvyl transferase CsaB [Lentibacillus populi]